MAVTRQETDEYIAGQVAPNAAHETTAQNIRNSFKKDLDYTDQEVKKVDDKLATIGSKVGELSDLKTTAKDKIVNAINEVNANKLNASTQLRIMTTDGVADKTITQISLHSDILITNSYLLKVLEVLSEGWNGLKFVAVDQGATISAEPSYNLEYSNNLGRTWNTLADTPVQISEFGMWVRGNGFTNKNSSQNPGFRVVGQVSASGSIMSLLDGIGEATTIKNSNQFAYLFYDCRSLVQAPELPATTLANSCYRSLFHDCRALVQAPELPATTLANSCYFNMFRDCRSLVQAPELPATTLASDCYRSLFYNCKSLVQAPELPATTLANNCYYYMFYNCDNLISVTLHATNISATGCLDKWLGEVATTGVLKCDETLTINIGESGIPIGWTRENL